MSGKFMSIKKIVIPVLTLAILASQLLGCAAVSKSDLVTLLEQGDQIEIEIASPLAEEEQGEATSLIWEQLALLETNEELRKAWDDILSITPNETGKNGMLYVDLEGNNEGNNTLRVALHNREFQRAIMEEGFLKELSEGALSQYIDLDFTEETKNLYAGINGYFNLLPDNTSGYANPDSTLNRAEFMAMVMRAETPVSDDLEINETFETAVGENDLNIYAQALASDSYLDIESKSLNNMTYNGTISRAEAVYLLMNHYYKDELATVDTKDAELTDVTDAGDIATKTKLIENGTPKDYWKSAELSYAIQNADHGAPTSLYKALVLAESKGIIDSETLWDEGLTKTQAVELLVSVYMNEKGIPEYNAKQGIVTGYTVQMPNYPEEGELPGFEPGDYTEADNVDNTDRYDANVDVVKAELDRLLAEGKISEDTYRDMMEYTELVEAATAEDGTVSDADIMIEYERQNPSSGGGTTPSQPELSTAVHENDVTKKSGEGDGSALVGKGSFESYADPDLAKYNSN